MGMRSPWTLTDLQKKQLQIGAPALISGQVSPEAAADNFDAMNQASQNEDASMKMVNTPSSLLDIGGTAPKEKYIRDDSSKRLRTTNRAAYMSNEDRKNLIDRAQGIYHPISGYEESVDEAGVPIAGVYDKTKPIYDRSTSEMDTNDPIQEQKRGLMGLDELLKSQGEANAKRSTIDFSPLAALADARNAEMGRQSNIAGSIKAPEDQNSKFNALAEEIQKRRSEVSKQINDSLKSQKEGTFLEQLAQINGLKQGTGVGGSADNVQKRIDQAQWNRAHIAHQQLVAQLAKDKPLTQEVQGYGTLSNSMALVEKTKELTPQQLKEAQRSIMQAMAMSGNGSTVGDERAQMYLSSIGQDSERVMQWLTGDPAKLDKNSPLTNHIINMAKIEQQNLKDLSERRINALYPGYNWIYEDPRFEDLKRSRDAALTGTSAQFKSSGKGGHATSSFSPDVTAYAKKHGISEADAQKVKNERMGK